MQDPGGPPSVAAPVGARRATRSPKNRCGANGWMTHLLRESDPQKFTMQEYCLPPAAAAATIVSSDDIPPVTSCLYKSRGGAALQKAIIT